MSPRPWLRRARWSSGAPLTVSDRAEWLSKRKILVQAYSSTAIASHEPILRELAADLIDYITRQPTSTTTGLDAFATLRLFAMDVFGAVALRRPFFLLRDGKDHPILRLHDGVLISLIPVRRTRGFAG